MVEKQRCVGVLSQNFCVLLRIFFYLFANLWHSPDKLCVCLQNVNGGKKRGVRKICMYAVVLQEIVKFLGQM